MYTCIIIVIIIFTSKIVYLYDFVEPRVFSQWNTYVCHFHTYKLIEKLLLHFYAHAMVVKYKITDERANLFHIAFYCPANYPEMLK